LFAYIFGDKENIFEMLTLGFTALHHAALQDCQNSLKVLLKYGANPRMKDKSGRTALHLSAAQISSDCCQILVESDSSMLEDMDEEGRTPLHYSVEHSLNCLKLFVAMKANINVADKKGRRPIHQGPVL
jgi:ankyrin repeat protein